MKRVYIILLFCISISYVKAQRFADFGILAGAASYNGEINPVKLLYKPSPSYGGFLRINIDQRHAVRVSGYYINLSGADTDFPNRVLTDRIPTEFGVTLMDYSAQFEFNFLPYISGEDKFMSSMYVAGGVGYSLVLSGENSINIPFGIGNKFNITDRLSAGLEWSFRKTFTDNLDTVQSPLGRTLINNNDWYSIVGLFISYKFVKFAADCPAYD